MSRTSSSSSSSSSSSQFSQASPSQLKTSKYANEIQTDNSPLTVKNKFTLNQEISQLNSACQNFTNAIIGYNSNDKEQALNRAQTTNQDKIAITTVSFQEEPRNPSKTLSSIGTNGRRLSKFGEAAYFKSVDAFQKYNHSLSNINQDLEKDLYNFNQITPLSSSKNNLLTAERNSINIQNSSSNMLFSSILTTMQGHGQQSKGQFLDVYDKNKQDDSETASQKKKKVKAKIRSSFRRAILANKQKNQNKGFDFFDLNKQQEEEQQQQQIDEDEYQKQKQDSLFIDEVKLNEEHEQNHSQSSEKNRNIQKGKTNANIGQNQKDEEDERSNDQNIIKQDYELVQKYINYSSSSIYNSSTLVLHVVLDTNTIYSKQLTESLLQYFIEDIQIYDKYTTYSSYLPQFTKRCQQNTEDYRKQYSQLINYFSQLEGSTLSQTIIIPTFSKGRILLLISRISLDELDVEIIKIENSMKQLMDQMDSWISFDFVKLITNTKKSSELKYQHSKFYNQKGVKRKEIQASSLIFDQKINQALNTFTQILTQSNLDINYIYTQYNQNLNNLRDFNNWISQQQFSDDIQGSSQQQQIQYIMKSNLCNENSPVYQNCSDISSNVSAFYYQGLLIAKLL
ncbi:hypothetical protein TTHERM_00069580 (macronuclear) [Tetrahymena thermophila SB210]|uniref:Uncharacterized protein n=1 Tax=Tetrahymena thermophila (strain SB210) TaxID=312017 RepID=I7M0G9_TETTS|nr:hypothetical protein TTHERM_00069580 [Tetrahymena thermophila SB210]EAR87551.2 hypothetical protein TTHERM_00069580 [Tetrahymena thermophila SB210]|eukprot:XP_001007796.2 hypothetical protein TTHERM_00069580 [Tetrahymena thermophila SB210]